MGPPGKVGSRLICNFVAKRGKGGHHDPFAGSCVLLRVAG